MTSGKQYVKSLSVPVGVYVAVAIMILYSRSFKVTSFFFEAVSIDLIISAPVLYFIAARKFKTRTAFAFPLMVLGFSLSKLLLPSETITIQWLGKVLLPMLELITIGSFLFYAHQFYKETKRNADADGLTVIRRSCERLFGRNLIAAALATELAVVYYTFIARRKSLDQNSFSSYRENGTLALYGFFIFIILAETFILHFLFLKWNAWFAWIVFGASIYVALQIFAHARALVFRPIEVAEKLKIRYGLAGDVTVGYDQIQGIILSGLHPSESEKPIAIGLVKLFEPHSVVIRLNEEMEVISFYGKKKRGHTLLLPIDNKERFFELIRQKTQTSK